MALDCPVCSVEIESRDADGLFGDCDEYACEECGASLSVSVVDEDTAYFNLVVCAHGADGETECMECNAL